MKNGYSNIFTFSERILKKTIDTLNKGMVVGLPTETVYGLGGNAYSKIAIRKIFKLKGRPKSNPCIIHYQKIKDINNDVIINENFKKLYNKLCPGPITFILKKKKYSKINSLACANLDSVAIRFPKHRIVKAILNKIKFPLAMPSANKSTSVSPVKANDVFEEFKKKISLIVDGGKCKVGIESTVIDLTGFPKILRPGVISRKKIENILRLKMRPSNNNKKVKSPGMMKKHYSPGIPVFINQKNHDGTSAFIYLGKKYMKEKNFFSLSRNLNLEEAASNLYKTLRLIKKKGYKKIQIGEIPNKGTGIAINDRIKRASKF